MLLPDSIDVLPIMGTYKIIKAVHRIDQNNRYTNTFEGAPIQMRTTPIAVSAMPKADSIQAIVVNNEDPLGVGCVQVDFPFDDREYSFWLRVMTPDAEGSDKVSTSRAVWCLSQRLAIK